MYDYIRGDVLFIMLYTVVTTMSLVASCYLLFRQGNAFAADITPPLRLRRWTAAFLASVGVGHLWYFPLFFLTSSDDLKLVDLIGGLLDFMTIFPLAIVVMIVMLQDRSRPLWPIAVMVAPLVVGMSLCIANRSYTLIMIIYGYFLLLGVGFIIYMVREVRKYGRWLRDNYADLEHKEVWQSIVVLFIMLLVFVIYVFTNDGVAYQYTLQVTCIVLISFLVWRVETLSDLSVSQSLCLAVETEPVGGESVEDNFSQSAQDKIGLLLQQRCIDVELYLQRDLTVYQLAKAVGTNRFYLSKYFARQGNTYNAYINSLRIDHFVNLYRKTIESQQSFTLKQLAQQSGFCSYSTFSNAFKQHMGKSVTAWIGDNNT